MSASLRQTLAALASVVLLGIGDGAADASATALDSRLHLAKHLDTASCAASYNRPPFAVSPPR